MFRNHILLLLVILFAFIFLPENSLNEKMSETATDITKPAPLSAKYDGSFAYKTVKDRMPVILTKVVDLLHRNKQEIIGKYGSESLDELKLIIGKLSKLKNEIQTDKLIIALKDDYKDVLRWNNILLTRNKDSEPSWFTSPWLYVECYMYRRIFSAFHLSNTLKTYDPFRHQKEESLWTSMDIIKIVAEELHKTISTTKMTDAFIFEEFNKYLELSLWGNKCDLSISAGSQNCKMTSPLTQLQSLQSNVLANDSSVIFALLRKSQQDKCGSVMLDVILDNSGFELFSDLCFAEFLMSTKLVNKIRFHVKDVPWFVSDAIEQDVRWLLEILSRSDDEKIAEFATQWRRRFEKKQWSVEKSSFWTLPFAYSELRSVDPWLYSKLSEADLIVFKGDLNYRKLSGDLKWDHTVSLDVALQGFNPAPLCTLRTLKADIVVGLKPGLAEKVEAVDEDWQVTGDYAVIQCSTLRL